MDRKTYRIGLALSGGGVRGAVHLGVVNVLQKNGIYPDIIAGTSAGSIVGALYAAGVDIDKFLEEFKSINPINLLDPTISGVYLLLLFYYYWTKKNIVNWTFPKGLFKGEKIELFLEDALGRKGFNNLKVPLSVISADINTGETVVFCPKKYVPRKKMDNTVFITDQSLAAAVRASISIPGIFLPKMVKGRALVDGGIKNNIPVDILYAQKAKNIIGVDLGVTKNRPKVDSVVDILMATIDIMGDELSYYIRKEYPGYYIYPNIQGVGYKDFNRILEIVEYGEKVAEKELQNIMNFLSL
ncbi:MAG TPA: patatin-like phospholipase family protein [Thermoanaerobacterales bacterium]|nr:patatin-like phospholipase family protein [Thermoanaerobacterales bacterium]